MGTPQRIPGPLGTPKTGPEQMGTPKKSPDPMGIPKMAAGLLRIAETHWDWPKASVQQAGSLSQLGLDAVSAVLQREWLGGVWGWGQGLGRGWQPRRGNALGEQEVCLPPAPVCWGGGLWGVGLVVTPALRPPWTLAEACKHVCCQNLYRHRLCSANVTLQAPGGVTYCKTCADWL